MSPRSPFPPPHILIIRYHLMPLIPAHDFSDVCHSCRNKKAYEITLLFVCLCVS
jgi:hypothetical protein